MCQTYSPHAREHIECILSGRKIGRLTFEEKKKYLPSYLVFKALDSQYNYLQRHPLSGHLKTLFGSTS